MGADPRAQCHGQKSVTAGALRRTLHRMGYSRFPSPAPKQDGRLFAIFVSAPSSAWAAEKANLLRIRDSFTVYASG